MKDSLAITAQAIPFLNDFKNFTYLLKLFIMYRKDNTFWTYCKKKRAHFPANPFTENKCKIFTEIKNSNYIEYQISVSKFSAFQSSIALNLVIGDR